MAHLHATESTQVYLVLVLFEGLAGPQPVSLVLLDARRPLAIDIQSVWTVVGPRGRPWEAAVAVVLRPL